MWSKVIGRPVVHVGGGHHLAALRQAGNQCGIKVGARGINGGGISGGAGAQDNQAMMLCGFVHDFESFCQVKM
jgi:hypothetical protein